MYNFKQEITWSLIGVGLLFVYMVLLSFRFRTNPAYSAQLPPPVGIATDSVTLDQNTISLHNKPSDCWIVINQKVYTVSTYLNAHPGGLSQITTYCGQDATQAFKNKGGLGQIHSAVAQTLLAKFFLGTYDSTVSNQAIDTTLKNLSQQDTKSLLYGGGDDD